MLWTCLLDCLLCGVQLPNALDLLAVLCTVVQCFGLACCAVYSSPMLWTFLLCCVQ